MSEIWGYSKSTATLLVTLVLAVLHSVGSMPSHLFTGELQVDPFLIQVFQYVPKAHWIERLRLVLYTERDPVAESLLSGSYVALHGVLVEDDFGLVWQQAWPFSRRALEH